MNVIQQLEIRMHPDAVPGFRQVIGQARLRDPILLSDRAMSRMIRPVEWMLRRVSDEGIRLTKSGYLPPAVVTEAVAGLGWDDSVGKSNREHRAGPLLSLRKHMRDVGLLRVNKGTLMRTRKGSALLESPRDLWKHVARTFHKSNDEIAGDATKILLLMVAARALEQGDDYREAVALGLSTLGWVQSDLQPVTSEMAFRLVVEKWRLLQRFGVFGPHDWMTGGWGEATAAGAAFARAALQ